jgi:probable HAF family extracellular repeat protein
MNARATLAAATLFGAGLAAMGAAQAAQDTFTAQVVDHPPAAGLTLGIAINDLGAVVCVVSMPGSLFWFTGPNGTGVYFPSLPGAVQTIEGINDRGQVVGSFKPSGQPDVHAFVTDADGIGTDLNAAAASASSIATGVNWRGQVSGAARAPGAMHAFISNRGETRLRPVGTLGQAYGAAINHGGTIAGWTTLDTGETHAFVTGPRGQGMTDLGTLGGDASRAYAINRRGQVVGVSTDAEGVQRAFITADDGHLVDLARGGVNQGFFGTAWAYGIGKHGHVVGYAADQTGAQTAFITGRDGRGMKDLNRYVKLPGGARLGAAKAINDRGQILAEDADDAGPLWLLTPTRRDWEDELER